MGVGQGYEIDVLGLGAVAIDDLLYVDVYPPTDAKVPVRCRRRQLGGLAGTALVTVSRLGGRAAYAGVLGDDDLSNAVVAGLAREGIDLSDLVKRLGARPIHSTVVVTREATRTIFFDTSGVMGADRELPELTLIRRARVLLVDNFGVAGMIRAARIARDAGIPVVGDFESDDDPQFTDLLSLVDHLILSADFAQRLTRTPDPRGMVARLWGPTRRAVLVTCGAAGVWYRSSEGGMGLRHQPAFRVQAMDSTGCGDVFHGAYAFALSRGLDIAGCIRVAAAAAAIKATRPGGQAGIPDWPGVVTFLAQHDERIEASTGVAAPE
jgi:sugar/nucleoside kinase (ribokinase family)